MSFLLVFTLSGFLPPFSFLSVFTQDKWRFFFYFRPFLAYALALRAASCKIIDKIHWMVQGGSTELGNFRDVGRACDPSFLGRDKASRKRAMA